MCIKSAILSLFLLFSGISCFVYDPERRILVATMEYAPIYGNSTDLMYYYVDMQIGTPSKPFSFLIDTGSRTMSLPCKGYCTACGTHMHSYYDLSSKYHFSNLSKLFLTFHSQISTE